MEIMREPPPGAPQFTKDCSICQRQTLHYLTIDDRNDELRGTSERIPVDRYETCTACGHTRDVTRPAG